MAKTRKIKKIARSRPTIEGAGVHLKRAFGFHAVELYDPFLLLDDFRSDKPEMYIAGFPWHPHRGIETITYMLEGRVEHSDSLNNSGVIHPGEVQWMTAGSGIIHQEMPKGDRKGRMGGFQLWANLPASHKMMDPRYREVKSTDIPEIKLDGGVKVKIVAGEANGVKGPVQDIITAPEYLDISIPAKSKFTHNIESCHNAIAYVIKGKGYFDQRHDPYAYEMEGANYFDLERDCLIGEGSLLLLDDGDQISVSTKDEAVRFLLFTGKPIGEPIAWQGPIVMNTQEELRIAFEEFQKGTFIKHKK